MKKRIMIVIGVLMCIIIVICYTNTKNVRNSSKNDKIVALDLEIASLECLSDLAESNRVIIEGLYCTTYEELAQCYEEGQELLIQSQTKFKKAISSPNYLETKFKKLEDNYRKTTEIVREISESTEEDNGQIIDIIQTGTYEYISLFNDINCFASLYQIRRFYILPQEEMNWEEKFPEFLFKKSVKCPPEITESDEMYWFWINQFSEKEIDKTKFLKDLHKLNENDNLASKKQNKKWVDFMEKYIQ